MRRALIVAVALVAGWLSDPTHAQQLTLAWDPSPVGTTEDTTAVGYVVNVGTESGVYTNTVNVGNALGATIPVEYGRTYYFAVAAFNVTNFLGALSSEVSGSVSAPPPPELCAPDGTGNLVDENLDARYDEGCATPPASPNGATSPPNTRIVDELGRSWLLDSGRQVRRYTNGGPLDWFAGGIADLLLRYNGAIYAFNAQHGSWWVVNGRGWTFVAGDPRVAAPPPPPPPPPTGCMTGGTLAPIGSLLTQTMKNGDVDLFIAARRAEGWVLLSRPKVRNQTTVTMECRGI